MNKAEKQLDALEEVVKGKKVDPEELFGALNDLMSEAGHVLGDRSVEISMSGREALLVATIIAMSAEEFKAFHGKESRKTKRMLAGILTRLKEALQDGA